jgi:O-antigen ligase
MTALFATPRLQRAASFLWGLVLLTLPVTSFRYFPGMAGTLVKPLAFYPLLLLLPILFILFWRQRRVDLPSNIQILLAFLLFALAASMIGLLNAPLPIRATTFEDRVLRGWVSLLIGLVFFFAAFWMNRDEADLRRSLKWLYAGLSITILWSLVQAVAINTDLLTRAFVNEIQLLFSTRPIQPRRISGFAYEPAWLADQIVVFYLPWLFAAMLTRRPLTARKWLEPLLFLLAIVILVFTYSRGGLLSAVVAMLLVSVLVGRPALQRALGWFTAPFKRRKKKSGPASALLLRGGLVIALLLALVVAVNFLAQYEYFASLWELGEDDRPLDYIVNISAGPRFAYALAGYKVFETAPLAGVGIGASGLALPSNYPEWSYTIPEIARQLSPDSMLIPNTKSLYVRLLAETGLPGFWLFVVFLLSYLAILRRMFISADSTLRFVAVAGLFAWIGLALRNLTQDSFTFPIMWVILGMLVGMVPFHQQQFRFGRK